MTPDNIIDTFAEDYAKGVKFVGALARLSNARVTLRAP